MFELKLDNYTIKKEDKYNFGLYKTTEKGSFAGKKAEGVTDKLIGYYGTLSGAIMKLCNNELLDGKDSLRDAKSILDAISTLKTKVNSICNIKPKDVD